MKIKTGFVCNAANMAQDNTINALGIITNMLVHKMPATVTPLVLVLVLEGKSKEQRNNKLVINFTDPKGVKQFDTIEVNFDFVPFQHETRTDLFHTLYFFLPPLLFGIEGDYDFKIAANGAEIGSIIFPVYEAKNKAIH